MKKPNTSQLDAARRVLDCEARETEAQGSAASAAAARRVCDRILWDLGLLMGATAARAILARSVKLAAVDWPLLATIDLSVGVAETLTERLELALRDETPSEAVTAAAAVYATLRLLLETLVGERLATKLVHDVTPGDVAAPKETS